MKLFTIENRYVSLSVDNRGCLVRLKNRLEETELIVHSDAVEGWRIVLPSGPLTVDTACSSAQRPGSLRIEDADGIRSLVIIHETIRVAGKLLRIRVKCTFSLAADNPEILARAEIDNRSNRSIDEFEFPIIGGLGGFPGKDGMRHMELIVAGDRGRFYGDVLQRGLPHTGAESHHFARTCDTAFFEPQSPFTHGQDRGLWLDLYGSRQGLYFGVHEDSHRTLAWRIEKVPHETPNAPHHYYPKDTPRWLRVAAVNVPRLLPGRRWVSPVIRLMPHRGDWHAGADRFSAYRHQILPPLAAPPSWMNDFVGWTEILGWPFTHEVCHTFRGCAEAVVKDAKVTGLKLVFLYGHTALGSEGADYDNAPARELGGVAGFRRMVAALHRQGIRIILLDHFHRYVNRDIPEFKKHRLLPCAVLKKDGTPELTREWGKDTFLSLRRAEGPTPCWVEMCPGSATWQQHYHAHLAQMIELGVDGLEVDLFSYPYTSCHNPRHGHTPGENTLALRLEFFRKARKFAKNLNPNFLLMGETTVPEARTVLDAFYPTRYLDENDRIYRYQFPEITQQAVLVGDYAYDQVNKALSLCLGVETEVQGLRKTALEACPALARYIGTVNQFRRKYASIMIHGVFRDTVGAVVKGDVLYSVIEGEKGTSALVLRNPHRQPVTCQYSMDAWHQRTLLLWQPTQGERLLRKQPSAITLGPYDVAVIMSMEKQKK
jgi:hypothetical protein